MRAPLAFYLLVLTGCCWLFWPAQSPPTPSEVVGHYKGNDARLLETLEIKADGTFHQQVLVRGRTFEARGKWRIDGRQVVFDQKLKTTSLGSPLPTPYPLGGARGLWVVARDFRMLLFDDDAGYGVIKQRETPSPLPSP